MSANFYQLLKYAKTGIASPDMTAYDKMRALAMAGVKYPVQTITGVPPISFRSDGSPLDNVTIIGNSQQTGTPAPDDPIMPEFVGVRTGNLFDPNSTRYHMGKGTSNRIGSVANGAMFYIKADADMTYTVKVHTSDATFVRLYLSDAPIVDGVAETFHVISESETVENPEVSITNTNHAYLWIQTGGTWYTEHGGSSIMLNTGSTALPHEPYGWKVPFTSANQTVSVYLGQVQTLRRVKKYEFTGEEDFRLASASYFYVQNILTDYNSSLYGVTTSLFSHYEAVENSNNGNSLSNNQACLYTYNQTVYPYKEVYIKDTRFATAADFKAYLSQQYAAGTPVTVWYVLAEPETGIVNEPLCKIGDYSDELHSEDAGITIPTVRGNNTLTVDTDLQSSSVSITGHIKQM